MAKKLATAEINKRLKRLPLWKRRGLLIERKQTFPTYLKALECVRKIGLAAERNDHHPDLRLNFKHLTVKYSTHSASGLTALDFKMAALVDRLIGRFC